MSPASEVKDDRKYTKEHEWAKPENGEVLVGISAFAVDQLGDITLVSIDVAPGDVIEAGKAFGTIESVKTLSDLYAPVGGKITRINGELENRPELINEDSWTKGWMIAISPTSEPSTLLTPEAYRAHLEEAAH